MNPPPWLAELHRRWQAARGKRTTASSRAFGIGWIDLLESAGIVSAEDQQTAQREAEALEKDGRLILKRHKFRHYLIERVSLPTEAEAWLHETFGSFDPTLLKNQALDVILRASAQHTRWPVEWKTLLLRIHEAFGCDRNVRPFSWQHPEQLRLLLHILGQLSEGEWNGVPIRSASVAIGLDSKALERHRRALEAGLSRMFGSATTLESLGLVTNDSMVRVHGPLVLVFEDGQQVIDSLGGSYSLSVADLQRAREVRTTADRILTVENSKTTFRQLAAAWRASLPRGLDRARPLRPSHKLDRTAVADPEVPRRASTRSPCRNLRHDPLAQVHRIALAHDPPPSTVNHASSDLGILRFPIQARRSRSCGL
jgi:hypothetical protein